jgi:hypothetical protein
MRKAIGEAESTKKSGKLKKFKGELENAAKSSSNAADASRMRSLAGVFAKPQF